MAEDRGGEVRVRTEAAAVRTRHRDRDAVVGPDLRLEAVVVVGVRPSRIEPAAPAGLGDPVRGVGRLPAGLERRRDRGHVRRERVGAVLGEGRAVFADVVVGARRDVEVEGDLQREGVDAGRVVVDPPLRSRGVRADRVLPEVVVVRLALAAALVGGARGAYEKVHSSVVRPFGKLEGGRVGERGGLGVHVIAVEGPVKLAVRVLAVRAIEELDRPWGPWQPGCCCCPRSPKGTLPRPSRRRCRPRLRRRG